MTRPARPDALALVAWAGTAIVAAAFLWLALRGRPLSAAYDLYMFHNGPPAILLLWLGGLLLRRSPARAAGLILFLAGVVSAAHVAVAAWADRHLVAAGADIGAIQAGLPLADLPLSAGVPVFIMAWLWVPAPVLMACALPLTFPGGTAPTGAARAPLVVGAAGGVLVMVGLGIDAWPTLGHPVDDPPAAATALLLAGGSLVAAAVLGAVLVLAVRLARAAPSERRRARPAGALLAVLAVLTVATYPWPSVWIPVALVGVNAVLVAYALSVARFRLHDMEPVLGRAAVAGALSLAVAGVYAAVVLGAGRLLDRGDAWLPALVAVVLVALAVEPARRVADRAVGRALYGPRAERADVVARVAAGAGASAPVEDLLTEIATLLCRSSGADRVEVWGGAVAPAGPRAVAGRRATGTAPAIAVPMLAHELPLGELRIFARIPADLAPDSARTARDVAAALAVVLHNERLTGELGARVAELTASRRRLVEAHDHARRGIERDIHDGAQAHLLAARLRLGAARATTAPAQSGVTEALDGVGREIDRAIAALRELARGVHPPLLEHAGVAAALTAACRGLRPLVSIAADGPALRYPAPVEAALYLVCMEAVQNAVRHSGGTSIAVAIGCGADGLSARVCDDGTGFDPAAVAEGGGLVGIRDRVGALGGTVSVTADGAGTQVEAFLPARPLQATSAAR